MSEPDSILPEIVIDDTAEDYVETDDEPSTPPAKSKPPATEIFEQENEPAPVPVVEPVIPKKPKRQVSEKQRHHLASIRAKALEARKAKAQSAGVRLTPRTSYEMHSRKPLARRGRGGMPPER